MAKHNFNKEFDSRNVPEEQLGPLENGFPDPDKRVSIRKELDEADAAEKRIFRR